MGRRAPTAAHAQAHLDTFQDAFKVGRVQKSSLNGRYDCIGWVIASGRGAVAVIPTQKREHQSPAPLIVVFTRLRHRSLPDSAALRNTQDLKKMLRTSFATVMCVSMRMKSK